jgi:VanZ family protein
VSATVRTREARIDVVLWAATVASAFVTLWWSLVQLPPARSLFRALWWSLVSLPSERHLFRFFDKLEHGLGYFVTTLLLLLVAVWRPGRGDGPFARWGVWVPIVLIAAGGAIEVVQSTIGRDMQVGDWIAEIIAVALAWGLLAVWKRLDAPRTESRSPTRA